MEFPFEQALVDVWRQVLVDDATMVEPAILFGKACDRWTSSST